MQQALRDYAPGLVPYSVEQYSPQMMQSFRPPDVDPKDPLNQARGDFNGDGVQDLALYGHQQARDLIVVLLSQADHTYKAIPLREWKVGPEDKADAFLAAAAPGPLDIPEGLRDVESVPPPRTLPHGGIDIIYDGAGELFYWDGTRFVPVTTGD